jgi:hypothetical protein
LDLGTFGLFNNTGDYLELVFSETIAAAPSEADSETNFLFVGIDGDNFPTELGGDTIIQLMTTTLTNDTIRYTFSGGDAASVNLVIPGTTTIDVNVGGLVADSIEDAGGIDLLDTGTKSALNIDWLVGSITDSNAAVNQVNENAANGTTVGITALAYDPNIGDTVTYSLNDDAGGRFAINTTSGEVTVADGTLLDHETQANHNITVRATSSDGSTSFQAFAITVIDINEAPTAANDAYGMSPDTVLNIGAPGVIFNDTDVDGDSITTILVTPPSNGSLTLRADGSLRYAPAAGFAGIDYFYYQVTDGVLQSNVVEVEVSVLAGLQT